MTDKVLVERKLRRIEDFLRELKGADIKTIDEFKGNVVVKRFIERNIELAIEQMIDICKHLVGELDLKEPETYSECFEILSGEGIIAAANLDTFRRMARFRNLLIHAYEGADDSITYGIYMKRLDDFKVFVAEIRNYLNAF